MTRILSTTDNITEDKILRALDQGIEDMKAGRELPLDEAFQKISEIRKARQSAI